MDQFEQIDEQEAEQAYRRAEEEAIQAANRAEHDAEMEAAIASGFLKWTPREGKRLADVGGAIGSDVPMVAEDLIPEGQVILVCGEEGSGKSWMAYQIAGELTGGGPVLGTFRVPLPVSSVLIVDVE